MRSLKLPMPPGEYLKVLKSNKGGTTTSLILNLSASVAPPMRETARSDAPILILPLVTVHRGVTTE